MRLGRSEEGMRRVEKRRLVVDVEGIYVRD